MSSHFFNKHFARILGLIGLLPFGVLSLSAWFLPPEQWPSVVRSQIGYGIGLLSFLGGLHWGGALANRDLSLAQTKRALVWGVTPPFISFTSLLPQDAGFAFLVLTLGFVVSYQVDRRLYQWYQLPDWFIRMRFKLTALVLLAMLLTFLAVNVRTH
jgi:hypothetical protein